MAIITAKKAAARNNSVDVLRIIAAFLVVYIHIHTLGVTLMPGSFAGQVDSLFYGISRLAVPLFFAISGWFLFDPSRRKRIEKAGRQIPRLIKLYLIAFIGTCLIYVLIGWILPHYPLGSGAVPFPTISDFFNIVFAGTGGGVLWFISSLIIIETIYYLVFRITKHENWLAPFSAIGLLLVLFGVTYASTTGWSLGVKPESWYVGISYFSIGYFLKKFYDNTFAKVTTRSIVVFTIGAGILYLYEYVLHTSGTAFVIGPYNYFTDFIMLPFLLAGVLLLTTRIKSTSRRAIILGKAGREYSLIMYIVHPVIISGIIYGLYAHFHVLEGHQALRLVSGYLITVIVTLAITVTYVRAKPFVLRFIDERRL